MKQEDLKIGGHYNWVNQSERLVYIGTYKDHWKCPGWFQFAKIDNPDKVWCEVRATDLERFEETPTEPIDLQALALRLWNPDAVVTSLTPFPEDLQINRILDRELPLPEGVHVALPEPVQHEPAQTDAQKLATAIAEAATKAGITDSSKHGFSGPQLLMLLDDLVGMALAAATPQPAQQQEARIAQLEARIAQLEAELMRMQGRELKLQFALAPQPAQQQEPVAHCTVKPLQGNESIPKTEIVWVKGRPVPGPLYTSQPPAKRVWVGLNAEECNNLLFRSKDIADAIERTSTKLQEKNP